MRESVQKFSEAMETVLKEHDWKGGWEQEDFSYLWNRLLDEIEELKKQLERARLLQTKEVILSIPNKKLINKEAVDVANFCMMIVDNVKYLDDEKESPNSPTNHF